MCVFAIIWLNLLKIFKKGAIYGALGSYKLPFLLAGCPPILCSLIMILMRRVKGDRNNEMTQNENSPADLNDNQIDQLKTSKAES